MARAGQPDCLHPSQCEEFFFSSFFGVWNYFFNHLTKCVPFQLSTFVSKYGRLATLVPGSVLSTEHKFVHIILLFWTLDLHIL